MWFHKKSNKSLYKKDATFYERKNKFYKGYSAFESYNFRNHFIRHSSYRLRISKKSNSSLFKNDASFKLYKK